MTEGRSWQTDRLEVEGVPDLFDAVSQDEGMTPPSDSPRFVEAVGVTPGEERGRETLRERVAQERPDRMAPPRDPETGRLRDDANPGLDEREVTAEEAADGVALSSEEAAVHSRHRP